MIPDYRSTKLQWRQSSEVFIRSSVLCGQIWNSVTLSLIYIYCDCIQVWTMLKKGLEVRGENSVQWMESLGSTMPLSNFHVRTLHWLPWESWWGTVHVDSTALTGSCDMIPSYITENGGQIKSTDGLNYQVRYIKISSENGVSLSSKCWWFHYVCKDPFFLLSFKWVGLCSYFKASVTPGPRI